MYTLSEKIELIRNSQSLREVQDKGVMPDPDSGDGYYFISYSHKDYKSVFCSILGLQNENVKLWYDRGLETGKSWLRDVRRRIYSYYCKGIVFYVSENFLRSESIWNEVDFVLRNKKSYLCIDFLGERLQEETENIPNAQARAMIKEMLAHARILPLSAESAAAAEEITALRKPQLFRFAKRMQDENERKVVSVNDISLKKAVIPDRIRSKGEYRPVTEIADKCFANCIYLEEAVMPENWEDIDEYAFYNCTRLEKIDLRNPAKSRFGPSLNLSAFTGCTALREISIPPNVSVGKAVNVADRIYIEKIVFQPRPQTESGSPVVSFCSHLREIAGLPDCREICIQSFAGCTSLESLPIPPSCRKIQTAAFADCSALKEMSIPEKVELIDYAAFAGCTALQKLEFRAEKLQIGSFAFAKCEGLRRLLLPQGVRKVYAFAFAGCSSLEEAEIRADKICLAPHIFAACPNLKTVTLDCRKIVCVNVKDALQLGSSVDLSEFGIEEGGVFTVSEADAADLDRLFPADTFYLKENGIKPRFGSAFVPAESDKAGYRKFVRR